MTARRFLVVTDIAGIHDFIFASNKLKYIVGASNLIATLTSKLNVQERLGSSGELVLAAGAQAIVEFKSADVAQEFLCNETLFYRTKAGLELNGAIVPFEGEPINALKDAQLRLRLNKQNKQTVTNMVSTPFFSACEVCAVGPAVELQSDIGTAVRVCHSCHMSYAAANRKELLKKIGLADDKPITKIEELGDHIALIYADLNDMGKLLDRVSDQDAFVKLSAAVVGATEKAIKGAVKKCAAADDGKARVIPLIVGGDDLMLLAPAGNSLDLTAEYCKEFENDLAEKVSEFLNDEPVTVCASVVITKSTYPFYLSARLAKAALKVAKQKRKERKWEGGCINWAVIKHSSTTDYAAVAQDRVIDGYELTYKPYRHEDLAKLLDFAKRAKSELPRNKLAFIESSFFYNLPDMPDVLTFELLLTIHKRLSQEAAVVLDEFCKDFGVKPETLPWIAKENLQHTSASAEITPFLDLLELVDYV